MMKNFFSAELCEKNMLMAYAHNIKRVEKKKLNYESDENACLHEKQNLDMLNEFFFVHKEMSGNIKKFFIKTMT